MLKGLFAENAPWKQFVLVLLLLVFAYIFSIVVFNLITIILGVSQTYAVHLGWLRFLQVFQSTIVFIVVPILVGYLLNSNGSSFYPWRIPTCKQQTWIIACMLCFIPIINVVAYLNKAIVFPESFDALYQVMIALEERAEKLTKFFLSDTSLLGLFISLFVVALIPAIGEELLFRGLLQKILVQWSKNIHLGIWISAVIFSFIHFQFFGFFPRVLLGAFFGYLFVYSGNLMIPILAHFFNNALLVFIYWLYNREYIAIEIDTFGANKHTILFSIIAVLLLAILFYLSPFRKK